MVIFWVSVLALSILLYVLLDGFDLGVGILFGLTRDEHRRRTMMSAVAPIWDGNETWLVVAGVVLWGAFPLVYATLFSALYLPLLLMLAGLILRGVAFEFRNKTQRLRWVWDAAFSGGSLVAAFMQGIMVGALVEGLPISQGEYSGGEFGWLSPFAMICGTSGELISSSEAARTSRVPADPPIGRARIGLSSGSRDPCSFWRLRSVPALLRLADAATARTQPVRESRGRRCCRERAN